MDPEDRLIVALDVPTFDLARGLVSRLVPGVSFFKVGSELFTAAGPSVVEMVKDNGSRVFLDLKYHDIPNTAAGACRAAVRMGVDMLNVHIAGGFEMLQAACSAVQEEAGITGKRVPHLLGVTVLTSINQESLRSFLGVSQRTLEEHVMSLARWALPAGLDGFVASPQETELLRRTLARPDSSGRHVLIVTPGIRPEGAGTQDQKRTATPGAAIRAGADYIVVGRPITRAGDPREAAEKIVREIQLAL